jgi:DNA primase
MQHPDPQISQLAASIGIESHQLSRNFALNEGETQLRQRITHLILDFRMDIVSQQLKVLQRQLKEAGSDMQRIKELMTAYQDAQTLRNELARRLGSDVIVS